MTNTTPAKVFAALVLLTANAHAGQPPNFGMPPQIAEEVKARCAQIFPSYDSQVTCIEMEAKAWKKLYPQPRS